MVTHAKAFGLQAIDLVNINFNDYGELKAECDDGARMGFTGKQIIHPNQIETTQTVRSASTFQPWYSVQKGGPICSGSQKGHRKVTERWSVCSWFVLGL